MVRCYQRCLERARPDTFLNKLDRQATEGGFTLQVVSSTEPRPDGAMILSMARARRRRNRLFNAFAVLLVLSAVGAFLYVRFAREREPAYRFVTSAVKVGNLREIVTATGTLKGLDSVDVGPQISGRIAKVHVDVNDEVKAGQVLAEIDPEQLRSRVEQSRAQVRAADAAVRLARATAAQAAAQIGRMRDLKGGGLVSNKDLEAAEADAERAEASVSSAAAQATLARASLKDAETSLSWSTIRAPIDGIVLARDVEPGQTVAVSLQSVVLFTVARDLSQLELRVDIAEADVGRVQRGQPASFIVDAWPNQIFASKVVNVHNLPTPEQTVVTYQGVLSVDNKDLKLRPGMTATASIVASERKGVLLVPNTALRFTPPPDARGAPGASGNQPGLPIMPMRPMGRPTRGTAPGRPGKPGQERVWVLRGATPTPVLVDVGGTDGQSTEIRNGLAPGDAVVIDAEQARRP